MLPVTRPIDDDVTFLNVTDGFGSRNVHPNLWAMTILPDLMAEIPMDDAAFEAIVVPPGDVTVDVTGDAPGDMTADEPGDMTADPPGDLTADAPGDKTTEEPGDMTADEPGDAPGDAPATGAKLTAKDELRFVLANRMANLREYGAEIVDQAGAFDHYFHHVLSISPVTHPQTARLIATAILFAGHVGMHWKLVYMRPRPAQVCPGVLPMIPTPPHPSYPSNHATQAHTVAELLRRARSEGQGDTLSRYLLALADRIAINRERAGVHFRSDTIIGERLGRAIAEKLADVDAVRNLMTGAREELANLVGTTVPVGEDDVFLP